MSSNIICVLHTMNKYIMYNNIFGITIGLQSLYAYSKWLYINHDMTLFSLSSKTILKFNIPLK